MDPRIKDSQTLRLWPSVLVLLTVATFIILADYQSGGLFTHDIDDQLRHVQIQDLLRDRDWWDPILPFVEQPAPYVSPWSRLVDAPYFVIASIAMLFTDEASALRFAESIVPPILLIFVCFFYVRILNSLAQQKSKNTKPIPLAIIAIGGVLLFASILEFVPGRIDHHNFQFLFLLIFIDGIIGGTRKKGWQAGAAVVASIAVGLELIPLLTVGIITQCLFALTGYTRAIKFLTGLGEVMCGLTIPLAFLLLGPSQLGETYCDSFSAPWISGLMVAGVFLLVMPRQWDSPPSTQHIFKNIFKASLIGVPSLIALGWLFPSCLDGPFVAMNPIALKEWLPAINQEKSILASARSGDAGLYLRMLSIMSIVVAITVSWFWRHARPEQRTIYVMMIGAIVFTCLQIRGIRLAWTIYALGVPALIAAYVADKTALQKHFFRWPFIGFVTLFPLSGFALSRISSPDASLSLHQILEADDCPDASFTILENLPSGHILSPLGLSMPLATHISDQNLEHTIRAVPFHRSDDGIATILQLLDGRQTFNLKSTDYIAICRLSEDLILAQSGVFGDALRGLPPAGFEEIEGARQGRFRLYQKK